MNSFKIKPFKFLKTITLFNNSWQLGYSDCYAGHFLLKPRNNRYCQGWFYACGQKMGELGHKPLAISAINDPDYYAKYLKGYISGWRERKLVTYSYTVFVKISVGFSTL